MYLKDQMKDEFSPFNQNKYSEIRKKVGPYLNKNGDTSTPVNFRS